MSAEPVLTPDVRRLVDAVAARYAGTRPDVLRLAVPPRHAAVERQPTAGAVASSRTRLIADRPAVSPVDVSAWASYGRADRFLAALGEGRAARAVWQALPGEQWAARLAEVAALTVAAGRGVLAVVPDSVEAGPPSLDWAGALLSLVAVASLVFAIIEGPDRGWADPLALGALAAGVAATVAFVAWELRVRDPLLDPRLFRLRGFSSGTLTITVQFLAAFGFFFVCIQYLQYVTGRTPLPSARSVSWKGVPSRRYQCEALSRRMRIM